MKYFKINKRISKKIKNINDLNDVCNYLNYISDYDAIILFRKNELRRFEKTMNVNKELETNPGCYNENNISRILGKYYGNEEDILIITDYA